MKIFIIIFTVYLLRVIYAFPYTDLELELLMSKYVPLNLSLADAHKDEVVYKLFKSSDPLKEVVLTRDSKDVDIDRSFPLKLFIHGWTTDDTSPWYPLLRDAYFKHYNCNIIYVDWSSAGNKSYLVSAANVQNVGYFMAQFIQDLRVPLRNVHLIGHSLGAQLASHIGKSIFNLTEKKIGRITGLDPAGPVFEHVDTPLDCRLNSADAEFVDVIHTDIGHYGAVFPMGHVDIYPNYGKDQPGCPPLSVDDNCSHARSTLFFVESVTVRNAIAEEGKIIEKENNNTCLDIVPNGKKVIFGDNIPQDARGVYILETNSQSPFLIVDKKHPHT